jgi:hypothetical protein
LSGWFGALTGRPQQLAHFICRLDLNGFSFDGITETSMRKHLRLFAQTLCFGGKPRFQGLGLFKTATLLHALLLSVAGGGSALGVLITDRYQSRAMTNKRYPATVSPVCPAGDSIQKKSYFFNELLVT